MAPNLKILNLSANGLDRKSLSMLLGLQDQEYPDQQHHIVLRQLSTLDLSRNNLSELPVGLSSACKLIEAGQRCKALAEEKSRAIKKVKEEAKKACDAELRATQKESQTKLRQMKGAFEKATDQAAEERKPRGRWSRCMPTLLC